MMNFEEEVPEESPEDNINCILWVGNLDSRVTEALLFEVFARVRIEEDNKYYVAIL